jgi:ubiquinone/menaquinone biosynthesis C-methylase UbiE
MKDGVFMNRANFGVVAESYARSRNDIPHQLFESLLLRNINFEGKRVADIGCGTGALTRKIKIRNGNVIGVDPSPELLEKARLISEKEYLPIEYQLGNAEYTGLDSNSYNIVTVLRAWHWFNREDAIKEVKRILKHKGTLLVMDSGFAGESNVVVQTLSVLNKYIRGGIKPAGSKAHSKQRINGFPVEWFEEWRQHELDVRDFYKLDYSVNFTNEEWVDRVESLSWMTELNEEDRQASKFELLEFLKNQFGNEAIHNVPHICTVCILTK